MSKTINSDLIRGNINTIILKSLYGGDRYGYDIIREIEEKSRGQYVLKQPTLYSCLKRLETQGFVSSYWGEQSNGGRRKYYTLTDMGREVFVQNQDEYEFSRTIIDQLISERDYDLDTLEPTTLSSDALDTEFDFDAASEADDYAERMKTAEEEVSVLDEVTATAGESVEIDDAIHFDETDAESVDLSDSRDYREATVAGSDYGETTVADSDFSNSRDHAEAATGGFGDSRDYGEETAEEAESETASDYAADTEVTFGEVKTAPNPSSIIDELLRGETENSYTDNLQRDPDPDSHAGNDGKPYYGTSSLPDYGFTTFERYGFAFDEDDETAEVAAETEQPQESPEVEPLKQPQEFLRYDSTDIAPAPASSTVTDYKSVLGSLVGDFDKPTDTLPAQDKPRETPLVSPEGLSVRESIRVRNFGKLSQSIREMGEEVKIRTPDSAAVREYNQQYYYYSNKLLLAQYGIIFLLMLVESLITFVSIKSFAHINSSYDTPLYLSAILLAFALPVIAAISFLTDPYKRKRVDFNFKNSMIFRLIIMLQLALIIYAVNVYIGMPIGGDRAYMMSMLLPCVLTINVPISGIIFNALYKSRKFAVK